MLRVSNLSVSIRDNPILETVSFEIQDGRIMGLIGHNGAGKSTTMKAIMGWQEKTQGEIWINEYSIEDDFLIFKQQFSYIPEEPLLLSELTVRQHFQLYGTSYQIDEDDLNQRSTLYAKRFDIFDKLDEYPESLSKGMRQKVQTICALLPDTSLLLIDEPFMGLDVYAAEKLEVILKEKALSGTSILLTSHQMEKVGRICDDYVLLDRGRVIEKGEMGHFTKISRRSTSHE